MERKREALSVCFLKQVFGEEPLFLACDFEVGPVRERVRAAKRHADACLLGNIEKTTPIRSQRLIQFRNGLAGTCDHLTAALVELALDRTMSSRVAGNEPVVGRNQRQSFRAEKLELLFNSQGQGNGLVARHGW